tara:strand:- start:23 stop:268 length:246 start_codon:yes stop_codon:yes gene_type:complete
MENYEKLVMEQAYDILSDSDFKWSYEFRHEMKLDLLNLLIEYFTDIEHYEKCSKLVTMIQNLENTNVKHNSETIETGSNKH